METADLGTEDFDEFIRQQQEKADAMFVEAEMVKELQRQYPLLAEQLGLLSDEQDPEAFTNFIEQKQKQVDLQQQEKDYIVQIELNDIDEIFVNFVLKRIYKNKEFELINEKRRKFKFINNIQKVINNEVNLNKALKGVLNIDIYL